MAVVMAHLDPRIVLLCEIMWSCMPEFLLRLHPDDSHGLLANPVEDYRSQDSLLTALVQYAQHMRDLCGMAMHSTQEHRIVQEHELGSRQHALSEV